MLHDIAFCFISSHASQCPRSIERGCRRVVWFACCCAVFALEISCARGAKTNHVFILFTSLRSPSCCARNSVKQFATFVSKTVGKRVELGQRSSVEHENYLVHVHVRSNGLAGVAVCDTEYPARVAFTLLMKIQEDFMNAYSEATWMSASAELPLTGLNETIAKYQDPHEADAIMKIQRDLDETKIVLHKTIDSVLERGVKLDNLVEKSTDLSAQSKM